MVSTFKLNYKEVVFSVNDNNFCRIKTLKQEKIIKFTGSFYIITELNKF
jgi:hypothetical protein